jgi:carboxypeptidase Taq
MSLPYEELKHRLREAGTLTTIAELLGWDQETMMPPKAGRFRAEQKALLSRLVHGRLTDPRIGELLELCTGDPALAGDPEIAANLREIRRTHDRAVRLPVELVAEMSETDSLAMEAWKQARATSDFEKFRPWLEKQVRLNRRKAECWGAPPGGELYDALLDEYEPGVRGAELERVFDALRRELAALIEAARSSRLERDPAACRVRLAIDQQREFNRLLLERLGFDLEAGRLDASVHPFSIGLGPGDSRLTTRYQEDQFLDAVGSTLHEAGHALYEQGLPKRERLGQPLAQPLGLAIHESQSRLWENHVGRSRAFWEWALPEARRVFGAGLSALSVDDVYAAVNAVRPRLIRVESDEATYHFHIMLRFDLERSMIRGELDVAELPRAWNERVEADLGLRVPDDRRGCLQDVHWAMGALGYFPTYTLGSLYAAQLWEAASRDIPDLAVRIARGEFGALRDWLRTGVHVHGRRYPAAELCQRLTGRGLSHEPLVRHLAGKLGPLDRIGREPTPAAD